MRIVEDKLDRKPKGFGYVEFGTLEGLKTALSLSNSNLGGRSVRVSVAEPRKYLQRVYVLEMADWSKPRIVTAPAISVIGLERDRFRTSQVHRDGPRIETFQAETLTTCLMQGASEVADVATSRVMAGCETSPTGREEARLLLLQGPRKR